MIYHFLPFQSFNSKSLFSPCPLLFYYYFFFFWGAFHLQAIGAVCYLHLYSRIWRIESPRLEIYS